MIPERRSGQWGRYKMRMYLKRAADKIREGYLKEMFGELRWMYQYIRKYRIWILFYVAAGILGIGMSLGVSVISKYLIDVVVTGRVSELLIPAAAMTGLAVGNIAVSAIVSRISAKITVSVQNEMRGELYSKILYSRWQELQLYSTGDLLNRLNSDMGIVSGNVISWIPTLVIKGFSFLASLAVILYFDPTLALLALVSTPVTLLISGVLLRKMRYYNKAMREISSDLMSFQNDSFQNLQTLKAFGLMGVFSEKMERMQEHYRGKILDYNKFHILVSSYTSIAGMTVSYLCLGWCVYRLWSGNITIGTLVMFLQVASGMSSALSGLIHLIPSLVQAATSAGRIMEVEFMKKDQVKDEQFSALLRHRGSLRLELKGVSVGYEEEECVLTNVNFTASSGEIAAFVGASGEGKTTMLRLLLGLLEPKEGSAGIYNDKDEYVPFSGATRGCFSYVPQGNTIFMGTIAENLRLVRPDATDEDLRRALEQACAWEFVREFPDQMNHYIGEHGSGISEGQAQRLAIARAILRDAPVLLLDEATSALDMETEKRVLQQIIKNDPGKICILTTHRPSVLSMCDRIYDIREGKIFRQRSVREK